MLWERYHRTHAPRDRDELVQRFTPLAHNLARRCRRSGEPLDDLAQAAAIGSMKAVERFNPCRGVAFPSYAVATVVGGLKRDFRDQARAAQPPRDLLEGTVHVQAAIEHFSVEHERSPTVPELAERLAGIDEEGVLEALHDHRSAIRAWSLDAPSGLSATSDDRTLGDRVSIAADAHLHDATPRGHEPMRQ